MVEANPSICLLWWEGCPSTEAALAELRAALEERGIDPDVVEMREIATDDQADRERFVGSPTIRVAGHDLFPPGDADPVGLSCRIYHRADGRVSPTPDPVLLRVELDRRLK